MSEHTKGEWKVRYDTDLTAIVTPKGEMQLSLFSSKLNPPLNCDLQEWEANARLIAAAPALLVVSHNLAKTMGIDYAIKKLSTMADDTMALGAATILKGIQQQATEAIAKIEK